MATAENGGSISTDSFQDIKEDVSPCSMPINLGFSTEQTAFVIDLIREYIQTGGQGPPRSLKELSHRLKLGSKTKKQLWEKMAQKLGERFNENFLPERVQRKWFTLVEGYKRVRKNNVINGKGPATRFRFFKEMDELIGDQDDFVIPVIGSSHGVGVRMPGGLEVPLKAFSTHLTLASPSILFGTAVAAPLSAPPPCSTYNAPSCSTLSNPPSPSPYCHPPSPAASTSSVELPAVTPRRPRKRRREDDMLSFLREAEAACQRRHDETLAQLKAAQESLEALLEKIVEKM